MMTFPQSLHNGFLQCGLGVAGTRNGAGVGAVVGVGIGSGAGSRFKFGIEAGPFSELGWCTFRTGGLRLPVVSLCISRAELMVNASIGFLNSLLLLWLDMLLQGAKGGGRSMEALG